MVFFCFSYILLIKFYSQQAFPLILNAIVHHFQSDCFHRKCLGKDWSVSGPMKYSSSFSAGRCIAGPINSFPFVWHLIQAKSVFPPTVCLELPPFGAKVCLHKWIHQEGGISWNWVKALQHLCTTTLEWCNIFIWNNVSKMLSVWLSVCPSVCMVFYLSILHYYTNNFILNYIFFYILITIDVHLLSTLQSYRVIFSWTTWRIGGCQTLFFALQYVLCSEQCFMCTSGRISDHVGNSQKGLSELYNTLL